MSSAEDKKAGLDPEHIPSEAGSALHSDVKVGTGLDDGGDYTLVYPPEGKVAETAKALNDAAVGREALVVWTGDAFRVPADVADAADLGSSGDTPESVQTVARPAAGAGDDPTGDPTGDEATEADADDEATDATEAKRTTRRTTAPKK